MDWDTKTLYCAGCGVEITIDAVVFKGKIYCCQDCLEGRPCDCGERMEMDEMQGSQSAPPSLIPS